jgi:cytochrome c-type biogenesis protein CcsB
MKTISCVLFSSKTTLILIVLLAMAMAAATFLENSLDTAAANHFIYKTKWFELIFVLLIINFTGHLKPHKFFSLKKAGGLIFHLSFIIMIIGAGITRYFGTQGYMHIREGETSNIIYTASPYLIIGYYENGNVITYSLPVDKASIDKIPLEIAIPSNEKGKITITTGKYIRNAVEIIEDDSIKGEPIIDITYLTERGKRKLFIKNGESTKAGSTIIAFNTFGNKNAVVIKENGGELKLRSPFGLIVSSMPETASDTIPKDSLISFRKGYLYSSNDLVFVYSNYLKKAVRKIVSGTEPTGFDAMVLNLNINGKDFQTTVTGNPDAAAAFQEENFDGMTFKFGYGHKASELPFSIHLNDFIIERYPGSNSPSSFTSNVVLEDKRINLKEDRQIYMNNVLDYDKYRFFQSSYDIDEKGTVLSVSHDFWGTQITYLGYLLMGIGFLITLFNKNSRFQRLRKNIREVREKRKSIILAVLLMIGCHFSCWSQDTIKKPVDKKHADRFGYLITQTFEGRFEPVHTLAYDVLHKISRADHFSFKETGKMDAMQVFLDMMENPELWQNQKIIYIREQSVRDVLGIKSKKAAFLDFFDEKSAYKLQPFISEAARKKPSEMNSFDKEILKVDERVNIFYMILNGSILKIFPESGSAENKWISRDEKPAQLPLDEKFKNIYSNLQLETASYSNIMQAYIDEVRNAMITGNYTRADQIIGVISELQQKSSSPGLLPSERKIKTEIFYNKAKIFIILRNLYGLLGLLALLLAFIENLKKSRNKVVSITLKTITWLLLLAFLYHTFGLALRWYLTGHAPWSNGYETLLLIAWGAMIAGFCFARNSKITLAATTFMAFLFLMTAGHSSYDPQLTNLQPVLKSYWLILHVASLTLSYAFLGLGFLLGVMNIFMYLFRKRNNFARLDLLITEHSYIIEMNLTIGLFLATIGTFLGGVWANESWGRYWGWDAKETWALIIILTYTAILHLRLIPVFKGRFIFNAASVLGFGSVIMTFVGVNYYLSKGLHSYGQGDTPAFPLWAWAIIILLLTLIISAGVKTKMRKE